MQQIDYTSRDYASLREELISVVRERIPTWNPSDPADIGVALIEAFAYLGDTTAYYIDRVVNEAYLTTATQRQNVLDIARMLGYTPASAVPAVIGSLRIYNGTDTTATVYSGTQFTCNVVDGGVQRLVTFEVQLDNAVTSWSSINSKSIPPNGSIVVRAVQGASTFQSLLGVSDGTSDQEFVIPTGSLVESTLSIAVGIIGGYDGATSTADPLYGYARYGDTIWNTAPTIYRRATGLASVGPVDNAYFVLVDSDKVRVRFGDGVNGTVPRKDLNVYATYRTGGGKFGNIAAGTRLTGPAGIYAFAESGAFGGTDPESSDSIRMNAPSTFRSRNRAVTKRDFQDLALTYPGISKAQARANNATLVTLYVAPTSEAGYAAPGYYASNVLARYRTMSSGAGTNTLVLAEVPANVLTATAASGTASGTTRTITTTGDHGFSVGQTVTVSFGDANYDGSYTILTVPTSTTFTYAKPSTTLTLTAMSIVSTTASFTTASAHGLSIGNSVTISGSSTAANNGSFTVTAVTSTTFSVTNASAASATTFGYVTFDLPNSAVLTTKYLTQGTLTVSGIGDGYDKTATPFTLISKDAANPDSTTGIPRPTVTYASGTAISTGSASVTLSGTGAGPLTGTATFTGTPANFPQVGEAISIGGATKVTATVVSTSTTSFTFYYSTGTPTTTSAVVWSASEGGAGTSAVNTAGVVTTGEDSSFTSLRKQVESFLEDRSLAGTNVTVNGPLYEDIVLTVTIYVEPTVNQSTAIKAAKDKIFSLFDYQNVNLGDVFRAQAIAVELSKLDEIGYAVVNNMSLSGQNELVSQTDPTGGTLSSGAGGIVRLLSGLRTGTSPYTASQGAGYAKDTYTEGNLVIKIGGSTGIADLGTA